jgi:hypothetical protein
VGYAVRLADLAVSDAAAEGVADRRPVGGEGIRRNLGLPSTRSRRRRLASFSLRSTAGSPEGFDTCDLKEANALLDEMAA